MTKDEALKMALRWITDVSTNNEDEVIKAIEEALEQPAQEPMAWMNDEGFGLYPTNDTAIPLYTHPHQWQGLTEKEILIICAKMAAKLPNKEIDIIFARAIEQALKEKNHG